MCSPLSNTHHPCGAPSFVLRNSSADPGASLAGYRTFNYVNPLGTDREGYESLVSASLKEVTTAELARRGYQLSEQPDFLVNFSGKLSDRLRVSSTSKPAWCFSASRRALWGSRWMR